MTDETNPDGHALPAERILDQAEIDAVLGFEAPSRLHDGDARVMAGAGAVPRAPMPMLPVIFDDLRDRLSLGLRDLFGSDVAIDIETLAPRRNLDALDEIVLPAQFVVFAADGWEGQGLLATGPDFATLALETLLGAHPAGEPRLVTRPYSQIETMILARIADTVLGEAASAFGQAAPVTFRREKVESDPRLVSIARPGDTVLAATLRVSIGGHCGRLALILPMATLEPVRTALQSSYMGTKVADDPWGRHLATEIWQSEIEAETVLHETKLPLRQVLALAVGDTLMFDMKPSDLVEIRCGGLTVTRGQIGRVDGRIAVQVAEPASRPRASLSQGLPS